MLTREQVEFHAGQIKYGHADSVTDHADVLLAHDAEQRQRIEGLAAFNLALSAKVKELEAEVARLKGEGT